MSSCCDINMETSGQNLNEPYGFFCCAISWTPDLRVLAVFIRIIPHPRDHKHKDREQLVLFFPLLSASLLGSKGSWIFFQPQFCSYLLFLQLKAFKIQPLDDCLTVSSQLTYNPADILDNVCFIIVKVSGRSCGLWRVFTETAKARGSESSCHGLTTVPIPCPLMLFMSEKEAEEFWSVWVRLSLGRKQVWEKVGLPLWDFFLPFYAIFNWQLIQCSSSCFYFVHDSNL